MNLIFEALRYGPCTCTCQTLRLLELSVEEAELLIATFDGTCTKQALWPVHTADMDETRQFCLVHVGGVNKPLKF